MYFLLFCFFSNQCSDCSINNTMASSAVSNRNGWSSTAISGMKEVSTALEAVNMSMVPFAHLVHVSFITQLPACKYLYGYSSAGSLIHFFRNGQCSLMEIASIRSTIPSLNVMASFSGFAPGPNLLLFSHLKLLLKWFPHSYPARSCQHSGC